MPRFENLDVLLNSKDITSSIMELDDFVCRIFYSNDKGKLSEPQMMFLINQDLEREVNNGGFNQYFVNTSGEYAHEAVLSLKAIGADKTAAILQDAIDQFPNKTVPKDRDQRIEVVEQIEEGANVLWDELTQKFFNYEDDLNYLNIEYIKKHKDSF